MISNSIDFSVSQKAPCLPVELTQDMMFGFEKVCGKYGGKDMSQQALKCLVSLPLAWSGLAVKESSKMSATQRDTAMAKTMQEIAVPGFIKLCDKAVAESNGALVFPKGYQECLYYTTLGTGKQPRKTWMAAASPASTVYNKFKSLKTDYTKGAQHWFDTNAEEGSSTLPSGTNTQDALGRLQQAMYEKATTRKNRASAVDLTDGPSPTSPSTSSGDAPSTPPPTSPPASVCADEESGAESSGSPGSEDDGPAAMAMAAAAVARTLAAEVPTQSAVSSGEKMPDDYVYPYILLACAWSSWSGQTPSEWKHLGSSSGPSKKKRTADVAVLPENPVHSPLAMGRVNPNGGSVSRRQHYAAQKKMKEDKENSNKENLEVMMEALEARKRGCAALEEANDDCKQLAAHMKSLVDFRAENARMAKRKQKIESLEKMLLLGLGDKAQVQVELLQLLQSD